MKGKGTLPVSIADAHRAKVQKATKTAMSKLMNQIGKPYHWEARRRAPVLIAAVWFIMPIKI